jgi:hypothetical protein
MIGRVILSKCDFIIGRARVICPGLFGHNFSRNGLEIMQVEDFSKRWSPIHAFFAGFLSFSMDFDGLLDRGWVYFS